MNHTSLLAILVLKIRVLVSIFPLKAPNLGPAFWAPHEEWAAGYYNQQSALRN